MNAVRKLVARADRLQQGRPWLAFPVAVYKKFGDDQAGNLAALIAYYGFASLFPLLLVLVTVLDIVLAHDPGLHAKVLNSAFGQIPVLGAQLRDLKSMNQTGPALVIGLILTFLGARGVAGAAQNALNTLWGVPLVRRSGFPWSFLRDIGLIPVVGIGILATTVLSGLAGSAAAVLTRLAGTPSTATTVAAQVGTVVVALLLNVAVFWVGFRLATSREIGMRQMLPSAVLAAIIWQILQLLGTYLVSHTIHSSAVYGVFAVVLGLLAWLYLAAQLILYAVEINVVAVRRLWPRSLAPPPLTDSDRQAYATYAKMMERRPEQHIESRITEVPPGQAQPPGQAGARNEAQNRAPEQAQPQGQSPGQS